MNRRTFFFGSLVGLVLVFATFIYLQERVVQLGDEVILATRPVDPRDLFRGEYVILRYVIESDERISRAIAEDPDATRVYVQLQAGESGVAEVVGATTRRPDLSTGTWLRGEVENRRVRYPDLEQYFVPEGAGRPIERMRSGLHVRVSVLEGEGRVVGLLDENLEPIDPSQYLE